MANGYDDTNQGALFKNHQRKKETHPNSQGKINIEGKEYWLSAWSKEIKSGERAGEKMLSIAATPVEQSQGQKQEPKQADPDLDDDVPF